MTNIKKLEKIDHHLLKTNPTLFNCSGSNLNNQANFFNFSDLNPTQRPEKPSAIPKPIFMKYKLKVVHFPMQIQEKIKFVKINPQLPQTKICGK